MKHLVPWALEDSLSNVHNNYHSTVEWIYGEILQEGEPVFITAEASRPVLDREEHIVPGTTSMMCIVVVTNYRWLRAMYGPSSESTTYLKESIALRSWPLPDVTRAHVWVGPPKHTPSHKYRGSDRLYENITPYFDEAPLDSLDTIKRKMAFSVVHKKMPLELLELDFGDIWITFKRDDGERVYSLLQLAKQNHGKIPAPSD